MQLCVIAGSGYDCNWELITTSLDSIEAYCPESTLDGFTTKGCADIEKRRVLVHQGSMTHIDYYGYMILWHEITHAQLFSDCFVKLNDYWECLDYANFHG